jgi:hypothetical protein
MFGRDKGFKVPAVAVAVAEGKEKRVELFVGERRSAEEEERTEKREGGSADMRVCVNPTETVMSTSSRTLKRSVSQ